MKIGYENRTCCVAGQVGIWKILVFGSKNQTQISEKLIFGPVKTGPKNHFLQIRLFLKSDPIIGSDFGFFSGRVSTGARFSDPKIGFLGILAAEKFFFILRRLDTRMYYYK